MQVSGVQGPVCIVLSTLFVPVLGHSWDTDERVFVNGASGPAPPPAHPLLCSASGARCRKGPHTVSDVIPFVYEHNETRAEPRTTLVDGEPWFVLGTGGRACSGRPA